MMEKEILMLMKLLRQSEMYHALIMKSLVTLNKNVRKVKHMKAILIVQNAEARQMKLNNTLRKTYDLDQVHINLIIVKF